MNLLSLLLPFACPLCHNPVSGNQNSLCNECLAQIPFITAPACPSCGGEIDGILEVCGSCLREQKRPWKSAYAVMRFEQAGKKMIHLFKYKNHPELARPLGYLAADLIGNKNLTIDFIVPMPIHWTRRLVRGYNQSDLLSNIIAKRVGIPVKKVLFRKKRTRQQARLSREERSENIKEVFSVKKEDICKKRTILLVDDVLTTGSTLTAATGELLKSGAAEVKVLVIARGY